MPNAPITASVQDAVNVGWHLVRLSKNQKDNKNASQMMLHSWCQWNLAGKFRAALSPFNYESHFAFQLEQDAVLFMLRWV